jgi:hypothetical protein
MCQFFFSSQPHSQTEPTYFSISQENIYANRTTSKTAYEKESKEA